MAIDIILSIICIVLLTIGEIAYIKELIHTSEKKKIIYDTIMCVLWGLMIIFHIINIIFDLIKIK